jgi:hypothetical protein
MTIFRFDVRGRAVERATVRPGFCGISLDWSPSATNRRVGGLGEFKFPCPRLKESASVKNVNSGIMFHLERSLRMPLGPAPSQRYGDCFSRAPQRLFVGYLWHELAGLACATKRVAFSLNKRAVRIGPYASKLTALNTSVY